MIAPRALAKTLGATLMMTGTEEARNDGDGG